MNLLLVIAIAVSSLVSRCAPNSEIDDRKASACRLTGGRPYVQDFAYCTTERGSCRSGRIYKGCFR